MPSSSNNFDYSIYLSPFTTRYGSPEMRHIWSEINKRLLWRRIWVALAGAEQKKGLVSKAELDDIIAHSKDIDIPKAKEIEKEIYHELMAEIRTFSEQCKIGGGKIHVGATSTDILDNTTTVQIHESLKVIKKELKNLLSTFAEKIDEYKDLVCMAYTHLQPAEPTTLGYRLSFYAQDLFMDLTVLERIEPLLKAKGMKGAVGTSASYTYLLKNPEDAEHLEKEILHELGLDTVIISGQTYPRKIDLLVTQLLANIASSLHKFCFDYRIMQQPGIGEWVEKRDSKRVGSSAMPFKRNPDKAEKVCSLCRYVASLTQVAWSNPALSLLERTLDDSANQRIFLPESFLAIDDCLTTVQKLLLDLTVNTVAVGENLSLYGKFAGIEPLLMETTAKGANRQEMHEILKSCSMEVWNARDKGENLDLYRVLSSNKEVLRYVSKKELEHIMNPSSHIGLAKEKTSVFLQIIKKAL